MNTYEVDNVMVVPYPMVKRESSQNQVIADKERQGLKYNLPDLRMF